MRKLIFSWIPLLLAKKTVRRFSNENSKNVFSIVVFLYKSENKPKSIVWAERVWQKFVDHGMCRNNLATTFVLKFVHVDRIVWQNQRVINADLFTVVCLAAVIAVIGRIKPQQ